MTFVTCVHVLLDRAGTVIELNDEDTVSNRCYFVNNVLFDELYFWDVTVKSSLTTGGQPCVVAV